jgi:hypothetical protein
MTSQHCPPPPPTHTHLHAPQPPPRAHMHAQGEAGDTTALYNAGNNHIVTLHTLCSRCPARVAVGSNADFKDLLVMGCNADTKTLHAIDIRELALGVPAWGGLGVLAAAAACAGRGTNRCAPVRRACAPHPLLTTLSAAAAAAAAVCVCVCVCVRVCMRACAVPAHPHPPTLSGRVPLPGDHRAARQRRAHRAREHPAADVAPARRAAGHAPQVHPPPARAAPGRRRGVSAPGVGGERGGGSARTPCCA